MLLKSAMKPGRKTWNRKRRRSGICFPNCVSSTRRNSLRFTKADWCVIPASFVTRLGLTATGTAVTRSFDGHYSRRHVYYIDLEIDGFRVTNVRWVAAQRFNVLLGRNVLNRFRLLLGGPKEKLELEFP